MRKPLYDDETISNVASRIAYSDDRRSVAKDIVSEMSYMRSIYERHIDELERKVSNLRFQLEECHGRTARDDQ